MRGFRHGWSVLLLGMALGSWACKEVTEAPTSLAYSTNPAVYTVGTAIPTNSPTHAGGAIESYSVSPALPDGLSLDTKSGAISGTPTTATSTATYTVEGTNSAGSATVALSITVDAAAPAITITTQPASQTILVGQTATFSVVATGTGTLTYQWRKDGTSIAGATSASYTTPPAVLADHGSAFDVLVSDSLSNTVGSSSATLTVLAGAGPGTFSPTDGMSASRVYGTATVLADGKVLVAAGFNGSIVLSSVDLFDPATESFAATGSLATPRQFHAATLLADGRVLVTGGSNLSATTATAELFDPATGTFTATGSMVHARADHSATLLPGGKVLVVGGGAGGAFLANAELYDPATGTFTATANPPDAARAGHSATLLGNGKVLILGGKTASALTTAELYDPALGTFTPTGGMAVPRAFHTATLLADGKVLVVGGAATSVAELYDPATGTFATTAGSLGTGRSSHAAALLPTGEVLIVGGSGLGSPAPLLATAELYDPASGTFADTGSLNGVRKLHLAVPLGTGKVLVLGGYSGVSFLASAELYH